MSACIRKRFPWGKSQWQIYGDFKRCVLGLIGFERKQFLMIAYLLFNVFEDCGHQPGLCVSFF